MSCNAILAHPLEDNTNILFDAMLAQYTTLELLNDADMANNNEKGIAAPCPPLVCTNVPNSSLGSHPELDPQPTTSLAFRGIQADPSPATSSPIIDNRLIVLAHQASDNETNNIYTTTERYFSVAGNIYHFGQDWIVRLHENLNASPYTSTPSTPTIPGQLFHIGLFNFYLDMEGRLHSVVDRREPLEPKAIFNTADEVWLDLFLMEGLSSPPLSIGSDAGETCEAFGSPISSLDLDIGDLSLMSPVSSESGVSESSIESDQSLASLFSQIESDIVITEEPMLAASPPKCPPTSTSTSSGVAIDDLIPAPNRSTATKAEIDEYADKVKRLRLSRKGSNQVQIKCPWCPWSNKRASHPSELKEHMYSHRGLLEFSCPHEGCEHVSNRKSNLTRHIGKHHPALAAGRSAKRSKRT